MSDFVIIAAQRTGSNMLVSILDAQPGVRCHGELFRRNLRNYKGALTVLKRLPPRFQSPEMRDLKHRNYIRRVKELDGGYTHFGYKLMLNQAHHARKQILKDPAIRKIVLYRENILAVYSSAKIAKITGQGYVPVGDPVKHAKTEFDAETFDRLVANHHKRFERARHILKNHGPQEYLDLEYLEACSETGIKTVFDFIGIPGESPIETGTVKRNSSSILDRFSNPDIVEAHLKKIDRLDWAYEGM